MLQKNEITPNSPDKKYDVNQYIIENATVGVLVTQGATFAFVNHAMELVTGYSRDVLLNRPFLNFVHPDDRPLILANQKLREHHNDASGCYEYRILAQNGKTLWVEMSAERILWQGESATLGFLTDITEKKEAQAAFNLMFQQMHDIIEFQPDPTFVIDSNKKVIAWNKALEELTGFKKSEMLGKGEFDYSVPFYGEKRPIVIDLVFSTSEEINSMYNYVKVEGDKLIAEVTIPKLGNKTDVSLWMVASPLYDQYGNKAGAIETVRDITEKKKSEILLRQSEEKFAKAFRTNTDAITINRLSDGMYLEINQGFTNCTGYTIEDIRGQSSTSMDMKIWVDIGDRERLIARLNENGEVINFEAEFRIKSGEIRTGLMSAKIIEINGELCILSTTKDITDQIQNERALLIKDWALDSAISGMAISDLSGKITYVNPAFLKLWGLDGAEEVLGKSATEFWQIGKNDRKVMDTLHAENGWSGELTAKKRNGDTFMSQIAESLVKDADGRPICMLASFVDITERKLAEKKLQESEYFFKESQRSAFVGSHRYNLLTRSWESSEMLDLILGIDHDYPKSYENWLEIIHPDDREMIDLFFRGKVEKRNSRFDKEYRIIRKTDGEVRWVVSSGTIQYDGNDNAVALIGTVQDITDRKQIEQNLLVQHDLILELNSCTDVRKGMEKVLDAVMNLEHVDYGGMYLADPADNSLSLMAYKKMSPEFAVPPAHYASDTSMVRLVLTGKPRYATFSRVAHLMDDDLGREGLRACAIIPIMSQGRLIAALIVASHMHDVISKTTQDSLETIAFQTGSAFLRLRTDAALRDSEERFRTFIEQSADGLALIDETGLVFEWNRSLERITGYSQQETVSRAWSEIYWRLLPQEGNQHEILDTNKEKFDGLITKGQSWADEVPIETEIITKDNIRKTVEWLSFSITTGKGYRIGATIRDITVAKHMEKALKQSELRFRQIADNVTDGFWVMDYLSKICVYSNPALDSIYGRPLTNKRMEDLVAYIHPDDRKIVADERFTGKDGELQFRVVRPDGTQRWLRSRGFAVNDSQGVLLHMVGVTTDITEYKKAAAEADLNRRQMILADKMATLGVLVSGVAHEINNPNNYLMLNAKIMERAWKDLIPILEKHYARNPHFKIADLQYSEARSMLPDVIQGLSDGTQRIKRIVDSLRNYARNDSADLNQEVDVNHVVESSIVLLSNMIQKTTDHFHKYLVEGPVYTEGNSQQLEQVLINLISNACQALKMRSQKIEISTMRNGSYIEVKIADQGCGIPPENLKRIFDPFFTTKREDGGTGLGLPISKNIIENHKGTIAFESEVGVGTTAILRLPVIDKKKTPQ